MVDDDLACRAVRDPHGSRSREPVFFRNNVPMARVLLLLSLVAVAALSSAPAEAATCSREVALGSPSVAYAAFVRRHAVAYRTPGRAAFADFGKRNTNGYPNLFSVLGRSCGWYHVRLPLRPNGVTGYVRARDVSIGTVATRIVVDLSARRLTLFRNGHAVRRVTVGIGSSATPTPTGSYYVNQRLVPRYKAGPWGPAALGISAFSPTLRAWTQGGPVAIHGTSDPGSVGRAESHGCLRVKNDLMLKLYAATRAGTPVLIHR
jgi:lipoprotein-anchoring transpeptidase ErfK/SrfK